MNLTLTRALWSWAAALALALLAIIPFATDVRAIAVVMVLLMLILVWFRAGKQAARQSKRMDSSSLPAADYRHPVVLVCGDGLTGLFGDTPADQLALRTTGQGCYLRVARLEHLSVTIAGIEAQRPGWRGQYSVMFVVNPGEHTDDAVLASQVRVICHQIALVRRRGIALPLMLTSYLQASGAEGAWFNWEGGQSSLAVYEDGACTGLVDWQRQGSDWAEGARRLQSCVQLNSVTAWLQESVLPHLAARGTGKSVGLPTACAIALVPALPGAVKGNLWQQWLRQKTALVNPEPALSGMDRSLTFPDPILPLLPVSTAPSPINRASVIAIWLFALAALIAVLSSAWQNTSLIRQISDELHRYQSIPESLHPDQHAAFAREEAVTILRQHALRLDSYNRNGEPLALGFGLYRGEPMRVPLQDLLTRHRPPTQAPMKAPAPVRLDSLSLFKSGSAQLKSDSAKVLINALVDIKAQPGWLIVIAGHTDAIGNAEHNLKLSRDRAASVRDWMQRMGDIADSCFVIQGLGATQPVASNDTENGRAANRRVDIRLVPEEGACAPSASGPGRQPLSHSATFND
jgi:outer membrane protein OmpA-like peptidoglycan-associated protein